MRIIALDLGDTWTGSALSDPLAIIAKPYKTIATNQLVPFLHETLSQHEIKTIVIGNPITLRGTISEQTKKVHAKKKDLEKEFPQHSFILWDERLTSKQASKLKSSKTKEEKLQAHSIAAAFILETYLQYQAQQSST